MGHRLHVRAPAPRRRPLLVLVLLLCVLSMHSLGGGHAGMVMQRAGAAAGASAHTPSPAGEATMAAGHGAVAEPGSAAVARWTVGPRLDAVAAAVGPLSGGPTPTPLCLAVLLLAAGLLARTGGWRHRVVAPAATAWSRRAVSPPGRAPPRDLLAQLCVLRT